MVSIGETVTFDCLPRAWPEAKIQWRHNGRLIEANETPNSGSNYLTADGGAKYVINKIAQTTIDTKLTPANAHDKSLLLLPSSVIDFQSTASSSAEMQANNNTNQDNNQSLVDLVGSQLVIRQVDKNDEGNYSCVVETKGTHRLIERESPLAKLSALGKYQSLFVF